MNIRSALYDRLTADTTLTAMLADYGGSAAVFSTDPVPEDAVLPYIVITGLSNSPFDTKDTRGREVNQDIRCFSENSGSRVTIENIAERVRTLLHRHKLTISGFTTWMAECSLTDVSDEDVYGIVVSLRLIAMET